MSAETGAEHIRERGPSDRNGREQVRTYKSVASANSEHTEPRLMSKCHTEPYAVPGPLLNVSFCSTIKVP